MTQLVAPRLVVVEGGLRRVLSMSADEIVIGRDAACDVTLGDRTVSKRHARLLRVGDAFRIEDLGSRNGVFVNGERVESAAVTAGDRILVGAIALSIEETPEAPPEEGPEVFDEETTHELLVEEVLSADEVATVSPADLPEESDADLARSRLEAFYGASRTFLECETREDLLSRFAEIVFRNLPAERVQLFLYDEPSGEATSEFVRSLSAERSYPSLSRTILNRVLKEGAALSVADLQKDPDLSASKSALRMNIRSVLAAPLRERGRVTGVLLADSSQGRKNAPPDSLAFFVALSNLFELAFHNLRGRERLLAENASLREAAEEGFAFIGSSRPVARILEQARKVAQSDATVLLRGESGTGKELIARLIHRSSARREMPLVAVNCAALVEDLLESELFGHERGAFTGAIASKAGKFERAAGGTLFLDEIGDVTPRIQAKLLRALETKEVERVGGTKAIRCDVRVIAATNRDLEAAVKAGTFREDLFFRLKVIDLSLPPLRERRSDIPELVEHYLARLAADSGRAAMKVSPEAMEILMAHGWPGNVRELRNVLERAVVLGDAQVLTPADLPYEMRATVPSGAAPMKPFRSLDQVEREHILAVLEEVEWNKAKAARILGINRSTLYQKLEAHRLAPPGEPA